jgi:hypothetical protein
MLSQEQDLDSEQSEDHEADDVQSDPEAGSEEDPFMGGNGKRAVLNIPGLSLTFCLRSTRRECLWRHACPSASAATTTDS